MRKFASFFSTFLLLLIAVNFAKAAPFDLVTPQKKVSIVYANDDSKLDSIAAHLLAADIQQVSGYLPKVSTDIKAAKGNVILIGSIQSALLKNLSDKSFQQLSGKWECYSLHVVEKPFTNIDQALVIAGSDARGTAYGVFAISEMIGVSPWYWWADAKPIHHDILTFNIHDQISTEPSVKYRGIFINDEDWGLQPWAAKTFEPETGDIGPKTYAKVFELLLRLKANFIWPAMHPSTKAFYHYPGNVKMAELYQVVIGSSHAEPMLRNNVGEWDEKAMGHFNYLTNKEKVYQYWEDRVKQSSGINAIYSMGMRGVHDGQMEGVKNMKEAVPIVEKIIDDERGLLSKYINKDVTKVPQVLTPYKEVLEIYENGLKVPDEITLMWPDDNYGYIQRLSNEKEQERSGGSGVYYHASYWGRPHDYLWLSTTHPALIREEMTKAYAMDARKIWVLNVGDIKPAEYNMQLFLDMAYRIDSFQNPTYTKRHLQNWVAENIDEETSGFIADLLLEYYNLAWERKPEYMGWSQTEPTTKTKFTAYDHFYFGDQAENRIKRYSDLEKKAILAGSVNDVGRNNEAYYQLVQYPIVCASLMNKKFLYRDKAHYYKEQARLSSIYYDSLSGQVYDRIVKETDYFNNKLVGGKWDNMMSMKPRKLPVFEPVSDSTFLAPAIVDWYVTVEGDTSFTGGETTSFTLPTFPFSSTQQHFIDVYLTTSNKINYTVSTSAKWIKLSQTSGTLVPAGLRSEKRIWISIDWSKAPAVANLQGNIIVKSGKQQYTIRVKTNGLAPTDLKSFKGFVQEDKYISIDANHYTAISKTADRNWQTVEDGADHPWLQAMPFSAAPKDTVTNEITIRKAPSVTYDFYTFDTASAGISIYTVPTYPLNQAFEMRYAISVDDGPLQIRNFKTVGRSEEWKQNVLSNAAVRTIKQSLQKGSHKLTVYMVDPGVILDHIFIDLGVGQSFYGALPETRRQ